MKSPEPAVVTTQASALRKAFDESFAAAPPPVAPPGDAQLIVRAGGQLLAIRRAEIAGLLRATDLTPTPGRSPAFLGLVSRRAGLYPVWSLAALVGFPPVDREAPGWLLLAEAQPGGPCAFACEEFERLVFVPDFKPAGGTRPGDPLQGRVAYEDRLVPVADLRSILARLFLESESTKSQRPPP